MCTLSMFLLIGIIFGFIVFLGALWFYWPAIKYEYKSIRKEYKDKGDL